MSHPHTRLSLGAICVPGSVFLPVPSRFSGHLFVAINPAERLDMQFACGAFSLSKPGCSRLWRGSFWYRKRVGMPLPKSTPHLVRRAFLFPRCRTIVCCRRNMLRRRWILRCFLDLQKKSSAAPRFPGKIRPR